MPLRRAFRAATVRRVSLLLFCLLLSGVVWSQDFRLTYDHFALEVMDLKEVGDYYRNVLLLEEIPHPSEPEGFRWFRISGNTQLHLIRKERVPLQDRKSEHLCLSVSDLGAFINHLEKKEVPYWDWPGKKGAVTLRADGVSQIYLQDPEKNWVEINTAKH